jgi:hypothetical protein
MAVRPSVLAVIPIPLIIPILRHTPAIANADNVNAISGPVKKPRDSQSLNARIVMMGMRTRSRIPMLLKMGLVIVELVSVVGTQDTEWQRKIGVKPLMDADSRLDALQAVLDKTYQALSRYDPTKGMAEERAEEEEEPDAH